MQNHCVPEWQPPHREVDFDFDPGDTSYQYKSQLWDPVPSRRSDEAYVPDDGFEELCWEDGELLVVMQGFNRRISKDNSLHTNERDRVLPCGDTADIQGARSPLSCTTANAGELMPYASTNNATSQEDELLSWLQHPAEETLYLNVTSRNSPSTYDIIPCHGPMHGIAGHTDVDSCNSHMTDARTDVATKVKANSMMNFANFSRTAAAIKADLHSVGMASGPRAADRLKRQDRPITMDMQMISDAGKSSIEHIGLSAPSTEGSNAVPLTMKVFRTPPHMESLSSKQGDNYLSPVSTQNVVDASIDAIRHAESSNGTRQGTIPAFHVSSMGGAVIFQDKVHTDEVSENACMDDKAKQPVHQSYNSAYGPAHGKKLSVTRSMNKRKRTAENHNLSERERRRKIKEKMKALQELIPNANKNDKASMLDEAIAYLRSLQQKVQVMALGHGVMKARTTNVVPAQLPRALQYARTSCILPRTCTISGGSSTNVIMGIGQQMLDMGATVATPVVNALPMPSPLHGSLDIPTVIGLSTAPSSSTVSNPAAAHAAYQTIVSLQPMLMPHATTQHVSAFMHPM